MSAQWSESDSDMCTMEGVRRRPGGERSLSIANATRFFSDLKFDLDVEAEAGGDGASAWEDVRGCWLRGENGIQLAGRRRLASFDSLGFGVAVVSTDAAWLDPAAEAGSTSGDWFSAVDFFNALLSGRVAWLRRGGVCSFSGGL